jgi:hypothetical protein
MATGEDSTKNFFPLISSNITQRPIRKQSRITKRKPARKNPNHPHFRFGKIFYSKKQPFIKYPSFSLLGGNRKDPLNLNALIEKKKQLTQSTNNDNTNPTENNNGNDRPVEILLQPDIFDPLRLDTSSRNDEDCSTIPSNSTNEQVTNHYPTRPNRYIKKRRNIQPPRYGNFQGYYGYRQPTHDQRLRYLEHDWFNNKQVLDVGRFIYKQKQSRFQR